MTKGNGKYDHLFRDIDISATQVETIVICPGNAGLNNLLIFVNDTDPRKAPGMHFVGLDADGPLMLERFIPKSEDSEDEKNLRDWLDSGRLHFIHLKRTVTQEGFSDLEFRPHQRAFGAGGRPEIGKLLVQQSSQQLEEMIRGKDALFVWGAVGGGIGTAVMKEVAEIAQRLQLPLQSITITPFQYEGDKLAIADEARRFLQEKSRIINIKNSKIPADKKKLGKWEMWQYVNKQCLIIYRTFLEITQVVGISNLDWEDFRTGMTKGNASYVGGYDVPDNLKTKPENIDCEIVVNAALSHELQDHDIYAAALLFVFKGPWPSDKQEETINKVKEKTHAKPDVYIKAQVSRSDGEMWMSVTIFGSYPSVASVAGESADILTVQPDKEDKLRSGPTKIFYATVNKKMTDLTAPASLVEEWKLESTKLVLDPQKLEQLRIRFKSYEKNGLAPDLPARVRAQMT